MLTYPNIDPVAIAIGPVKVHWYGIMYLLAFASAWALGWYRAGQSWRPVERKHMEDLLFYVALGVVLGGRFGYVMFYNFGQFLDDPLWLFRIWEGGMSFHGGLLGVIIAVALFARRIRQPFFRLMDFVAPLVPPGLLLGRLGNFIGGELWGRATDVPWAMVFPKDTAQLPRHPSQLYEAFLEGLVLFAVLYWYSRKPRPTAAVSALFVLLYGIFRFSIEFVREPDAHIQFDLFEWVTRGQILSTPMIIVGAVVLIGAYVKDAQKTKHKV